MLDIILKIEKTLIEALMSNQLDPERALEATYAFMGDNPMLLEELRNKLLEDYLTGRLNARAEL